MILYETDNWLIVFANKKQKYLGRCKIVSKKERQSLVELTVKEREELSLIEKELERAIVKLFSATMFNFACLMNDAYKNNETPLVHFHLIPRYKNTIKIFGKEYKDFNFGNNIWKTSDKTKLQKNIFTDKEIEMIYNMIKKEVKLFNEA